MCITGLVVLENLVGEVVEEDTVKQKSKKL